MKWMIRSLLMRAELQSAGEVDAEGGGGIQGTGNAVELAASESRGEGVDAKVEASMAAEQ